MRSSKSFLHGLAVVAAALVFLPTIGFAQNAMERPRNIRADICPAPELVNMQIVLDPNHPRETYSGPIMRAPGALNLPGAEPSSRPAIVPVEPPSTDEVLRDFRQDFGLDVPAVEFLFASVAPAGGILCHYRSDVVEPVITIRTNSATCSVPSVEAWTQNTSSVQRCDASRQRCVFHCTD